MKPDYQYARQASPPDWFDPTNPHHYSVTSGSSPFNEWYAFASRDDALEVIRSTFQSQSFIDQFVEWGGEFYSTEGLQWDGDIPLVERGTEASIDELLRAESRF